MKVSIGIAPNLFLAKLASDMQKPDGLVVLEEHDVPAKIRHLDLRALNGVGKNMETRLHEHGIRSIDDLYRQTEDQLHTIWGGVGGNRFYQKLRGVEVAEIHNEMGSISHSHVLPPTLRDRESALAVLNRLTQKAAMRLRKACHTTGHIAVKVTHLNAPTWESNTRVQPTQDTLDLVHAVTGLWKKYPIRKSGRSATPLQVAVVFDDLVPDAAQNFLLFGEDPTKKKLNTAIDVLNTRYGKRAAYFGGAHQALDHGRLAIAFNHIPDVETEG
jgi:DNA polymerase-4